MFFDMFLEKTKLKYDRSNDAGWVHDLRIILIAAQKNYVLDALLGDIPIAGADADVMNVWQARYDDYLIVFAYICCRSIARSIAPLFLICSERKLS